MLTNVHAVAPPTGPDQILVYYSRGTRTITCRVMLDTLGKLVGKPKISQLDALDLVNANLVKLESEIEAKYKNGPLFPSDGSPLIIELTFNDLKSSGIFPAVKT